MSTLTQLSIFVENKMGELKDITNILEKEKVSIKTINLVNSSDFGLLRLIVDKTKEAKIALEKEGFSLKETKVFGIETNDYVGCFNNIITRLFDMNVDIEYTYTVNIYGRGVFIFKVNDSKIDETISLLEKSNVKIVDKL